MEDLLLEIMIAGLGSVDELEAHASLFR
jgi:hypothetical protein